MPLRIIVVGAGIGGLTAALALGKQGHEVNVYEKSQFSNETGAAFHIGPHANRVLQGLDVDMSRMRPAICAHWYECSADLENIYVKFCCISRLPSSVVTNESRIWPQSRGSSAFRKMRSCCTA